METAEAVRFFLRSCTSRSLSPETVRWYKGILLRFATMYSQIPESPEQIEIFLADIKTGDERRHGYYRTLNCFYHFLSRRYNLKNPITELTPPRIRQKIPKCLTPSDLNHLLCSIKDHKVRTAILFQIDTGARLGETVNLQVDDLDETPWGFTAAIKGKTGARIVPISYETYHSLMVNLPFTYKAPRLCRLISRAFKDAGIIGTAHVLRHSFGTLWQGDELVLQRIMGHAHLSTTRIYRHIQTQTLSEQHHKFTPLKMVLSNTRNML